MIQEKLKLKEILEGELITVRPNLNKKGQSTLHRGRLGQKIDSVQSITIDCTGVVIRNSGLKKALNGEKTVHAGLLGFHAEYIPVHPWARRIVYNPAKGLQSFFIVELDGSLTPYTGGGKVTCIRWKYYLV